MRAFILYHPNSEQSRQVEEFAHDFNRDRKLQIELISLDTRDGAAIASLYDIVQYPAIAIVQNDGHVMKEWQGDQLPLMSEVASYLSEANASVDLLLRPSHSF